MSDGARIKLEVPEQAAANVRRSQRAGDDEGAGARAGKPPRHDESERRERDPASADDLDALLHGDIDTLEDMLDDLMDDASFISAAEIEAIELEQAITAQRQVATAAQDADDVVIDIGSPAESDAIPLEAGGADVEEPPAAPALRGPPRESSNYELGTKGAPDTAVRSVAGTDDRPIGDEAASADLEPPFSHIPAVSARNVEPVPVGKTRLDPFRALAWLVRTVLSGVSFPVRFIPERHRYWVDYIAITLALWAPLVWLLAWLAL